MLLLSDKRNWVQSRNVVWENMSNLTLPNSFMNKMDVSPSSKTRLGNKNYEFYYFYYTVALAASCKTESTSPLPAFTHKRTWGVKSELFSQIIFLLWTQVSFIWPLSWLPALPFVPQNYSHCPLQKQGNHTYPHRSCIADSSSLKIHSSLKRANTIQPMTLIFWHWGEVYCQF